VAVAVNEDGKRELGVATGPLQAEAYRTDLLHAALPIVACGA
jgi:hypothetical protein